MRAIKCFVIAMLFLARIDLAHAWDIKWVDQFGNGSSTDADGGATTDATGVYVGGSVFGALPSQIGAGGEDAYLRKYTFDGSVSWTRQFGTPGTEFVEGVATDATGVYVAGRTTGTLPGQVSAGGSDVFVRKYDTSGNVLWTRQFGTPSFESGFLAQAIAVQGSAVYVGGLTFGTFPSQPAGAGQDLFVAKIDATGALVWVRQFGVRGAFVNNGGITTDDTGVYVVGNLNLETVPGGTLTGLLRKYDFDGNLIWGRDFDDGSDNCGLFNWGIAVHAGQVYLVGQANIVFVNDPASCGPGLSEVVGTLRKYDGANGNFVWARRIKAGTKDGRDGFTGAKVVQVSDSGIYVGANATVPFPDNLPDVPRSDRSQCPGLTTGKLVRRPT